MTFALYAVPMSEVIECALIGAILRNEFPAALYEQRRGDPDFAKELPLIEALERVYADGGPTDPLIARSLKRPLSTGDEAFYIVVRHHRLFAAAATDVADLQVYVGTSKRHES